MKKTIFQLLLSVVLPLSLVGCATAGYADNCETSNEALESMSPISLSIKRRDGSKKIINALLADNGVTRAAGFQKLCGSTIDSTLILFTFPVEVEPSFHMNNVVASLDIAFIKSNGRIVSIQLMKPYSPMSINKPLYSPHEPVIAALEAHKGFFKKFNIREGDVISWEKAKD